MSNLAATAGREGFFLTVEIFRFEYCLYYFQYSTFESQATLPYAVSRSYICWRIEEN